MIRQEITELIKKGLDTLGLKQEDFIIEHPKELQNGDYSTNIALVVSKTLGKNPQEFAEEFIKVIEQDKSEQIEKIEIAGPGFINFHLSAKFFENSIKEVINQEDGFGFNNNLAGQNISFEYTSPGIFKQLHIGHLMANVVGESLSRLAEANGATVNRSCYYGDIGLHVAKAVWGMLQSRQALPEDDADIKRKVEFLSNAYVFGNTQYEESTEDKKEIESINKKLYENSDSQINEFYEKGKEWSLEYFHQIYIKLGTKFDNEFFESDMAKSGKDLVLKYLKEGIFEESDGAVVYKGEQDGLHTRVFINSAGLPTYEAKDIGLFFAKKEMGSFDRFIVVTANEQQEYFKVVKSALKKIDKENSDNLENITHGMMRLDSGKMSSRKGNVITGSSLIEDVDAKVSEKIKDRDFTPDEAERIRDIISVGAIKYSILKQSPGKDIVFDFEKSISFEGDSGPYLEYTATRAKSLLHKALGDSAHSFNVKHPENWQINNLEKLLYRFPEIIEKSYEELAPQQLVVYLTDVASTFNSFYGNEQIIDGSDPNSNYKLALSEATRVVLENGLKILGIKVPEKM